MRVKNQNDVFHVRLSKWKVWVYTFFCWAIACLPLLGTLLFIGNLFNPEQGSTLDNIIFIAIFGTIFLIFAAIPLIFLTKLNRPMATFTRNGFSGMSNLKRQSHAWTPDTVLTGGGRGNTILENLDATQSRASKLLGGPKATVIVHHLFAKQKYTDILEAIEWLSPYPVKQITMWDAAKY